MQADPSRSREPEPPAGEAELIDKLVPLVEALIEKPYLTGTTYRDARLRVYPAIARFRHEKNDVVFREPTPQEPSF